MSFGRCAVAIPEHGRLNEDQDARMSASGKSSARMTGIKALVMAFAAGAQLTSAVYKAKADFQAGDWVFPGILVICFLSSSISYARKLVQPSPKPISLRILYPLYPVANS